MILKQKLSTQIKMLFSQIIIAAMILYIGFAVNFELKVLVCVIFPMLVILIFPTAYLHWNYYQNGVSTVYHIDNSGILMRRRAEIVKFEKQDFKKIQFFMNGAKINNLAIQRFSFESYFFVKIIMLNGKEIIITCLFAANIDVIIQEYFAEIAIEKNQNFYPIISS